MEQSARWQRAELLLFTLLTILSMLPFIAMKFFPSMDGASHLSNSNIISQLIFHDNDLFQRFFKLNPEPVPNWTGHALITILTLIMPAFLAEKLMIIALLTATPFAFRSLVLTISPGKGWFSFLVFPFVHPMFFFFGFYNFCIGILLFLITLTFWLRSGNQVNTLKKQLCLALFVTMTYFSHVVIFGLLLIVIALHIITEGIFIRIRNHENYRNVLSVFLRKTTAITLASLLPLLLLGWFFSTRHEPRSISFLSQRELLENLVTLRPLISFNPILESKKTAALFWLLIALIAVGISFLMKRLIHSKGTNPTDPAYGSRNDPEMPFWWLLLTQIVLLTLYFFLPEAFGTASYINLRIAYFFFLMMILWLATFRIPWYFGLTAAVLSFSINILLIKYYVPTIYRLGKLATECNQVSRFIEDNKLVLPINCREEWFTGHFVDYLSIDKPIVMVYNYECESGYFPVVWNRETKPNYYMGNPLNKEEYSYFEIIPGNPFVRVDYVFLLGMYRIEDDWFYEKLDKILALDFEMVYQSENCYLYRNKRPPLLKVPSPLNIP